MFSSKSVALRQVSTTTRSSRVAFSAQCSLSVGAKVKVVAPITVYHVGKFKDGLKLEGLEGTIVEDVSDYKGMTLSANLPWKVQFMVPGPEGKDVKVLTHMEEDEIKAL